MNWKRGLVASLVVLPVLGLFAWGLKRDPNMIPSPLPGRDGPDFALPVFAPGQPPLARQIGDTVRLSAFKGQVVVLNFWASWCLACRDEHATLSAVARRYAGSPVHFVGVLYADRTAAGSQWISEMGGQAYPSVDDPRARTAIDYGLYGVPETFFLDKSGRVAYKHIGPVSEAVLTRLVDSLMAAPAKSGP